MHFREWNRLHIDSHFTGFYSKGVNWIYTRNGLGNEYAPNNKNMISSEAILFTDAYMGHAAWMS